MSKLRTGLFLAAYCIAIWMTLDFVYTAFFMARQSSHRVPHPVYSHGFRPNFDGYDKWGPLYYRFVTNSLGFRDGAVREVPKIAPTRRVVVIGDSFTEGLGMSFEDSFAGLLYRAGQSRADPITYLNAGVVSYSPTLYFRKIKYLLDSGLTFDEVIVFSDISDVQDESYNYFCFDDDPRYKVRCKRKSARPHRAGWDIRDYFMVTRRGFRWLKFFIKRHTTENRPAEDPRGAWTIPGFDIADTYQPLGIEGGIKRSISHMQALADLLAQRHIPLTIVVYPWPIQIAKDDRNSRQVAIWREFCAKNCKQFIDLFPLFFAYKDAHPDWYDRLFIQGDVHFSVEGNKLAFEGVAKGLRAHRTRPD